MRDEERLQRLFMRTIELSVRLSDSEIANSRKGPLALSENVDGSLLKISPLVIVA